MEELKYFLALSQLPGFGPVKFEKIFSIFPSLTEVWQASLPELMSCGLTEEEAQMIVTKKFASDPETELIKMEQAGICAVTIKDSNYPPLLKEIYGAPPILYYRGDINCLKKSNLAVVGSRKHTAYGKMAVEKIIPPIAQCGITIVSGLALGIDALAHQTTLDAKGITVAVLGSDLSWENIGPKTNFHLAEKILETGGCLLSDNPLGTPPNKTTFPQRNRIVSGLSRGVLVIEATDKSGSLITAGYALEQNRDVFAVPGNIFSPYSEGTNNLIKKGAKLTASAEDIIGELACQMSINLDKKSQLAGLSDEEKIIIENLSCEPVHLDKLAEIINIRINVLNSKLMIMELNGLVRNIGNGKYVRM
jgi:DNA processing protein